ncbi:hypothetical protein RJ639_027104 [Escallonia herrerae]|uniref:Reverse transcriptase Ty1/copia-type domain-containing protein n=1 Tax=Escallonia herrerae TaxID=1293975 RepID=A0AA88X597_9ASTE|nr:hypothetical protein RJ639_027104 [Escallonia herrerae]
MFIAAKRKSHILHLKKLLSREFDMKDLGSAKKILGMEIHRDRKAGKLWVTQKSYVEKVLERFSMLNAKPVSIPLGAHFQLSSQLCLGTKEDVKYMSRVPYANAVGCLMYAMVCTRPDISHAVSMVSRYMGNPGKKHWDAVKWIFRYLAGSTNFGVMFDRDGAKGEVSGFVDSDYAGDLDSRRSTTGYIFTFYGGPICWKSVLQSTTALSTTEAEYMTLTEAAKEALWLKGLVEELGFKQRGVLLQCDNQSALDLAKNQVFHARTKYIDVRYHRVREWINSKQIVVHKVHTNDNAADMLTKTVTTEKWSAFLPSKGMQGGVHKEGTEGILHFPHGVSDFVTTSSTRSNSKEAKKRYPKFSSRGGLKACNIEKALDKFIARICEEIAEMFSHIDHQALRSHFSHKLKKSKLLTSVLIMHINSLKIKHTTRGYESTEWSERNNNSTAILPNAQMKEKEKEELMKVAKVVGIEVAAVAGVALAAWGISTLFSGSSEVRNHHCCQREEDDEST